ncbi:MAG: chromosome segregation protein SMC, partial [Janthinobacterium lividum]
PELETRWRAAQATLTAARAGIAQTEQALKLEAAQRRNAELQLQQLDTRRERLRREASGLDAPDATRLDAARARLAEEEGVRDAALERLAEAQAAVPQCDAERRRAEQRARDETARIAQLDARLGALRALQDSVQTEGRVQPWLGRHELQGLPRLWKRLQVERGWETAVESVLRERLAALEISNLDWVEAFVADAPPAKLAFYAPPPAGRTSPVPAIDGLRPGLRPLLSLIRIDDSGLRAVLGDWLASAYAADDLAAALAARAQLPDGACLVVPAGHQVSRCGIALYAADSENAGMLERAQEIDNLSREVRAQAVLADEAKLAAGRAQAGYERVALAEADLRRRADAATRDAHALQLDVLTLAQAFERFTSRSTQIGAELEEIDAQRDEQRAAVEAADIAFEVYDATLAESQARFEDRQMAFERLQEDLDAARQRLRELERGAQDAGFDERNLAARIGELQRTVELGGEQLERIELELEDARGELAGIEDKTADTGLQQALAVRMQREQALAAVRTAADALTLQLRQFDEMRLSTERSLQPLRERITEFQLKEQAARLSGEQFAEQLAGAAVDIDALRARLAAQSDPQPKPAWLQAEVTRINQAIQALGAVNMAALEELTTARERKGFLDAQSADLVSAITTLEDAIHKIDQETRELLQGTFNEVNRHFGELFPRLFGGGQAKLVMTGDEILDAGVQVLAQPPGKKNTTIHLLSGGEKALTATALVFAMFQLNPAPFCLLDEVDAPLDDANTGRFANLVRAMSEKTQFLFISHNKIAMEMAQQLIGVTMQEQGVSRIVAVDMESAAGFVDNK